MDSYKEFLSEVERDRVAGGRIYDAHIAQIARRARVRTVLTENRRHFTVLLRDGIRVLTAKEGRCRALSCGNCCCAVSLDRCSQSRVVLIQRDVDSVRSTGRFFGSTRATISC